MAYDVLGVISLCDSSGMLLRSERAFENALSTLNRFNLTDVWTFCCLLSMADIFGGDDSSYRPRGAFFPILNSEQIRLFAAAVLSSRAAEYKSPPHPYRFAQFRNAYNALSDVVGGDVTPDMSADDAGVTFLAPLLNRQVQAQAVGEILWNLTRSYVLMADLPQKYRAHIEKSVNNAALNFDMDAALMKAYGLNLERFLRLSFAVMALYIDRNKNVGVNANTKELTQTDRQKWLILGAYLTETEGRRGETTFTAADLAVAGTQAEIVGFLTLIAASTANLRAALARPEYRVGGPGLRLSPMERHPIVNLGEGRYVVPDLATYGAVVANVPYMAMLDDDHAAQRDAYRRQQGAVQELYLQELVQTRLPAVTVLEEREYRVGRDTVKGPDLTVIEPDGNVVLVESKARRINPSTRVEQGVEELVQHLEGALLALQHLPKKWKHLRQGQGGHEAIGEPPALPISVVVTGETHILANQKLRHHVRHTVGHPLSKLTLPYLILSVEEFEKFVEIAAANSLSLHNLLKRQVDHVQKGPTTELWDLNGYTYSRAMSYLAPFENQLFGVWLP